MKNRAWVTVTQMLAGCYDLLTSLKASLDSKLYFHVILDFGSLQDERYILATYGRVWVTAEAVQAKFAGCSFDNICEQPSEVNDLALKGSDGY